MRPVLIAGPTASGKSRLAERIAERDGGCVVNADALQVYGCWRVLTARPDASAEARVPHALYGHVDCAHAYSVGDWLRDLAPVLADLEARRLRPVIVGGSGLYLSALTEGLAQIPPIAAAWRTQSTALIAAGRLETLRRDLAAADPATHARIDLRNPRRVQRAWEVLRATGRGLAAWQRATPPPQLPRAVCDCVVTSCEIPLQNNCIETRFHRMLERGALAECAAFGAAGHDPGLPSAQALGRAELTGHLDGRLSLNDASRLAVTATRRYAKRQRSWFRSRMADWRWIDPASCDPLDLVPQSVR